MNRKITVHGAVEAAWSTYLEQHDVTVPMVIKDAVESATKRWLDQNRAAIVAAIADASRPA